MSHTPGPWTVFILDKPRDEIGAYVQGCANKGPLADFYFVSGVHPDGSPADVCHVGNGPTSEGNARAIAALPSLIEIVQRVAEHFADTDAPLGIDARAALTAAGVTP